MAAAAAAAAAAAVAAAGEGLAEPVPCRKGTEAGAPPCLDCQGEVVQVASVVELIEQVGASEVVKVVSLNRKGAARIDRGTDCEGAPWHHLVLRLEQALVVAATATVE